MVGNDSSRCISKAVPQPALAADLGFVTLLAKTWFGVEWVTLSAGFVLCDASGSGGV
jgi:hypothetical protein